MEVIARANDALEDGNLDSFSRPFSAARKVNEALT
jgi:hypothetical protein